MKRKLLKSLLCLTICGSVITGLFSEPFLQVWATASASKETLDAIDQAEEEKEPPADREMGLNEEQLKMVEEIVLRYQQTQPRSKRNPLRIFWLISLLRLIREPEINPNKEDR